MKSLRCAHSTGQALYRVFVKPTTTFRPPACPTLVQRATLMRPANRNRHEPLTASEVAGKEDRGYDPRYQTVRDIERSGRSRLPKDHEITDPLIMVLEAGVLEGPLGIGAVMKKIHAHESLRMVKPFVPPSKKDNTKAEYAICKIVDKKAEFQEEASKKERKKEGAKAKPKTKELELTWVIGNHDLEVKLKNLRRFLEGGNKVQVVVGKKKRSKAAVEEGAATELVKRLRAEADTVSGREYKPADGDLGQRMTLFFSPKGVN